MATSVIRNFLFQAPGRCYFPLNAQHSPSTEELWENREEMPEESENRDDEERDEELEEEDDIDCESEVQEEEDEEVPPPPPPPLPPPHQTLDMTRQLLRFADVISNDVQRYFGRCAGAQDSCDIYSDSFSVTTSGRLRYYDDLLKIARTGSPEDQEINGSDGGLREPSGSAGLGPLAELFDQSRQSRCCSQPMVKRHLPLSFWTEPIPCCSLLANGNNSWTDSETLSHSSTHANLSAHEQYHPHLHSDTSALDNAHPDFSDLLANWDPPVVDEVLNPST